MEAIVLGSTGLIGSELLKLLDKDQSFTKITALVRKKTAAICTKVIEVEVDFGRLPADLFEKQDIVFCCLGTTIKKAGSKEAFRKVDYEYPLLTAKIAKEKGVEQFAIVTAMGSNPQSKIFYNNVKGDVESALKNINFESLGIFRPSMLLGDRAEVRTGERIGQAVMNFFSWAIPKNYKAIQARSVAIAMVNFAKNKQKGNIIIENGEML